MITKCNLKRAMLALPVGAMLVFSMGPAFAADAPKVTAFNYVRAESDIQMKGYIENYECFGKFAHSRKPYDVNKQVTIRGNRDTI